MELTHRFTVPASIDETWKLLNDLHEVGECFPGAAVESVDGDDFSGTVKVKLGPISMQYKRSEERRVGRECRAACGWSQLAKEEQWYGTGSVCTHHVDG